MSEGNRLPEATSGPWVTSFEPMSVQWPFSVNYNANYAEDTPFFHALAKEKLLGSWCRHCNYKYATPRTYCMQCGKQTEWFELPKDGRIHSWTICYYSGEPYLQECPFMLGLIEFEGVDTLFMTRIVGISQEQVRIGMKVQARFRRKKTWSVNDVYFVAEESLVPGH